MVGAGATVAGDVDGCVVWPGAYVAETERLAGVVRAGRHADRQGITFPQTRPRGATVITAIVLIDCANDSIPEVAETLANLDGVSEVYSVAGGVDLIAIVRVREFDQIAEVIAGGISKVAGRDQHRHAHRVPGLLAARPGGGVLHRSPCQRLSAWSSTGSRCGSSPAATTPRSRSCGRRWARRRGSTRPFAEALCDAGLTVVVADLRGTGDSGPPPRRTDRYGYAELADDVGAVLAALKPRFGDRRTVLVGHSLGGQVALLRLATNPESTVDGIVLVAVGLPYWRLYPGRRER